MAGHHILAHTAMRPAQAPHAKPCAWQGKRSLGANDVFSLLRARARVKLLHDQVPRKKAFPGDLCPIPCVRAGRVGWYVLVGIMFPNHCKDRLGTCGFDEAASPFFCA